MSTLHTRIDALTPEQRRALKSLVARRRAADDTGLVRTPRRECPLSPPQQRLWLMSQLDGASSAYNIPAVFRLDGRLDAARLADALAAVQARHEILRTRFHADADGRPFQRIEPIAPIAPIASIAAIDFALLPAGRAALAEEDVDDAVRAVLLEPFDLAAGPAWRARVLPVGADAHVLILSFHHIVFDGWSLGVLARELFELYAGKGPALPAPAHQYSDYVAWRQRPGTTARAEKDAAFWREALSGELPLLELPADRARPQAPSYRGAIHKQVLPRALFDRLVAVARAEGATPYAAFLALLKILLYRHTGQPDLIVGTPVSGRERAELHGLLGVFVNTLPIRSGVEPTCSFRELVAQIHQTSLQAFAHQELPFDAIVEAVNPPRVAGFNPVFQVLYTYQNALPPLAAGGLAVRYLDVDCGTAKFDLSLDVFEGVDGPTCIFEYSTDLFDAARIERMAGHFAQLAESVAAAPGAPVAHLPMLASAEIDVVFASAMEPPLPLPYRDFVSLFEQRCDHAPDAVAVRDGEHALRYAALDEQANRIARALAARGVRAGDVVGVSLPRSARLVAAVVGVMKAGAAFVALEPEHPLERLAFAAGDAGIACLLHEAAGDALAARLGAATLDLDRDAAELASLPGERPAVAIDPDEAAYVVYTSGTTGRPKGVAVTHRNWMNAYLGWERVYALPSLTAHLQMASFAFDVFCGDLVRALGSGRTLVICPHELYAAPDALHALMQRERVDFAEFVPAVFRAFADHLAARGKRLDFMRVLVVASDSWYVGEYRSYRALLGPRGRLVNSYGMAEATIDSTWFEGDVEDTPDGALVPIGRPFPNVEVRVCDANLEALPVGVPGEICVGGAGVARGYLNRPEVQAAKFVADPLGRGEGARLYRTGDIGRMRADGSIELFGRRDTQVKIRGMRIELGEIEMILRNTLGAVRDCAVVVREDRPGERRVVAYVVADAPVSPARLNERLAEYLPAYMLPAAYVELDALPLSANGKVDRNRLPACDAPAASQAFVSPRTLTEEMLATIFVQIFDIPRVGVHDSFFELGGHSLLAFQVVARAREAFNVDLPLQALFEHPTIAGLAAAISELQGTREAYDATINALPAVVPDPDGRHAPFPLTEVQQAYWLGRNEVFEFGNVTTHSYDEMETYAIDVPRFQRAWNKVVARHDMLRAQILHDGTQQILREVPEYAIRVLDLREGEAAEVEAGIESVRAEMSHQMLDVHRWPVFDVRVTLLPGEHARIHFSSDALVFDVWSFVIIIEELVKLYLDEDAALPPLALSFRDYVIAEEQIRRSDRYRRALDYWRARVEDLPGAPQLPMAMDPAQLKKPRFTRLHAELDREAWGRLKRRAVGAGLTTTGLMLAAYAEVLAAYSRDPAFSLNLTFLNRHPVHPQVNDIVGEFTSLTLLSVDQSRLASFVERARRIQGDLWNDLEHHDISGVQVLRDLARRRGGTTRAKMPVVFTSALVVPIPKRRPEFPIIPVYRDGVTQTSQVWLDCGVWEDDQVLLCNWDVVLELYPEGLVEEMFDAYWTLVRRLADDDAVWRSDVRACAPPPAPTAPPPAAAAAETLDALFLASLARDPAAPAVLAAGRTLSYLELAEHAAWVRSSLADAGVERGELVAVAMPRGWEPVAAMLGIVNAGAAYLPLDPALPDERLRALLEEGRVRTAVTTPSLRARLAALGVANTVALHAACHASAELLVGEGLPGPDDLAYVIFTSGSTGKPKGVAIEHRGAANTVCDVVARLGLGAADRVLALSSASFDLSVFDVFGTLAAGGAIVVPGDERRLDPTHWAELVRRHGVTVWNSVPALCALLTDTLERSGEALPSVRHVLLSGDWIPVNLPARLARVLPAAQPVSLGGATEASIWSIWYPIGEVPPHWTSIPYGRPMAGQDVRVLDHRLEPCPTWVSGELYIAGTGLARGYWNDAERTAAAFVVHPRTGERLYRTGDVGRRLPDGNIEFLGREDQQVKVQGYRIELGEIEAALLQHPAVRAAAAVCHGERHAEKRLALFYCLNLGFEEDAATLRAYLLGRLPEYMVPHALVELAALPLSGNGKLDRKALAAIAPIDLAHAPREAAVAPRNDLERAVAAIWQEVLDLPQVGVESDFFALGGDSMHAIKLLVALRHTFACDIALREVFVRPTVAAQAALVAGEAGARIRNPEALPA